MTTAALAEGDKFITAALAASLVRVTERHLSRLVAEGWIEKASGRYTLFGVVGGYIRYLKDEARRNSRQTSTTRTQEARAREIELRIAQQERTLVVLEDCLALVDAVAGAFRSELSSLPAAHTRDQAVRAKLQEHCDGILLRVAKLTSERCHSIRTGQPDSDTVEEDDAGPMGTREPELSAVGGRPGAEKSGVDTVHGADRKDDRVRKVSPVRRRNRRAKRKD